MKTCLRHCHPPICSYVLLPIRARRLADDSLARANSETGRCNAPVVKRTKKNRNRRDTNPDPVFTAAADRQTQQPKKYRHTHNDAAQRCLYLRRDPQIPEMKNSTKKTAPALEKISSAAAAKTRSKSAVRSYQRFPFHFLFTNPSLPPFLFSSPQSFGFTAA